MDSSTFSTQRTVADLLKSFQFSENTRQVVFAATLYAQDGTVDALALFSSALDYGRTGTWTAASFLRDSLLTSLGEEGTLVSILAPKKAQGSRRDRLSFGVSAGVWAVFEDAKEIRGRTGGKDSLFGLRHLLFALCVSEQARSEMGFVLKLLPDHDTRSIATELIPFLRNALE